MKFLKVSLVVLFLFSRLWAIDKIRGETDDWTYDDLMALDTVESAEGKFPYSADILAFYRAFAGDKILLRTNLVSMRTITKQPRDNLWEKDDISVSIRIKGAQPEVFITIRNDGTVIARTSDGTTLPARAIITTKYDMLEVEVKNPYPALVWKDLQFEIRTYSHSDFCDYLLATAHSPKGPAHCAFMHHGNQALAYTDVFRGRGDDPDGSGFDEALEIHDLYDIPICIHMSGPLQSDAAWYDPDFNAWVARGTSEGWIDMIGSAYAQHIMPFVQDNMNDWAVYIHRQMTHNYYNYWTKVAWVPERTYLATGTYPDAGVIDNIADDFTDHDIEAIILDDDVHLSGYDNHQIHTISGTGLKAIPRDHDFTGRLHAGDGAGAMSILEGLAASAVGDYRIVVYADDWEMAAEIGEWASSMPNAKETYDWMIEQCHSNSAWLHTWKLTDAIYNSNFNGVTLTPTYGSYGAIGGSDGYGGGNNGWYTHWAGYASPSDHHSPQWNFGYIWSDARNNLMTAPDNNISQMGWYVLMTNLFETGWHDGMGGPIAGWEMKFSTHIKNANVYAEGARWANGDFTEPVAAYFADYDHDGDDELVIYNDRVFAVFEAIGGRAVWIFAKNGTDNTTIVGNDNAYWEGTEGDYNDANHIAALSDVGVGGTDYEHQYYDWEIEYSGSDSAVIVLRHGDLRKRISVRPGEPFLRCEYFTRDKMTYIKTGYSPDMVNLLYGPDIQRIWKFSDYCGFRNQNTNAVGAIILGDGGAEHNAEFSSTYLRGDEIRGKGTFGFYLYAGWQTATAEGYVPAFDTLSANLGDDFPPDACRATYNPGSDLLVINFTDAIDISAVNLAGIGFDQSADGSTDLWLDASCSVVNTSDDANLRIQLSPSEAAALESLSPTNLVLVLSAGAVRDTAGNLCRALGAGPDQVYVNMTDYLAITIDGYLDTTEWHWYSLFIDDPDDDSEWDPTKNEIWGVYLYWDSIYVYFAINGIVETFPNDNAWLLYIDTDYGGPNGVTDLTEIDNWNRQTVFSSSSGFKCDYQYGSYTGWDGDFWRILSPTSSEQVTTELWCATDLGSANPASEIAVSWDQLYGLGRGRVPSGATIALVASIASDIALGGDCAPNNITSSLPTLDSAKAVVIDADNDGYPDPCEDVLGIIHKSPQHPQKFVMTISPNPFNSTCEITVPAAAKVEIYSLSGKKIASFPSAADRNVSETRKILWHPGDEIPTGIYLVKATDGEKSLTRKVLLIK